MKVSYKLIRKYIDCPLSPEAIAQKLTMAGLEVGAIEKAGLDLNRCIVGQVLDIKKHPEADLLTVCQVDIGTEILTIVCGARNMKAKDKVPVALIGCHLPGGPVIKRSKIRGVVSEGMMCSERELGLSEESSGLLILPADAPIGMEVAQYLELDDIVLDLELTPNRGDCLSIRGITREIAALTGGRMKETTIAFPESGASMKDMVSIQVEAPDLCPRYTARVITGVTIGPSPRWLVQYLTGMGFRSINNVVDVTNFVMMEWGQPLHAFDYDLIQGKQIVVRRAREGEKLVTLDGVERLLGGDKLVIADANRAIALAGVMGGANTEVSSQTQNILLESAFFNQISIRKTAKFFGLASEASYRFERGIDPEGLIMAVNRAAQLILEIAGGSVAHGIIDAYPVPFQPRIIFLHLPMVKKYLGLEIPKERVIQILQDLEFSVDRIDEQKLKVRIPLRRWDIEREVDLIEEIARIFGYENIPVHLPAGVISTEKKTRLRDIDLRLRNILVGLGFSEAINYSFISGRVLDALSEVASSPMEKIYVKNPLVEDQNVMRDSLMVGLCQNVAYNQNRKAEDIRLFELGRCFAPSSHGALPEERNKVGIIMQGSRRAGSWLSKPESVTFFDIKGIAETLLQVMGIRDYTIGQDRIHWLDPNQSCSIMVKGRPLGFLGKVRKSIQEYFNISREVFALEIDFELLNIPEEKKMKPVPKYPPIMRDLSVIVPEEVSFHELEMSIREMNIRILKDIRLFDLYRGGQIPPERKSFGLSLTYQSLERTLTDKEVNTIHEKIIQSLGQRFQAALRE